jgi:hypothetical protein
MCGIFLSFWGIAISTSFVAGAKPPFIYVMDVQIIMVKRVNGLSECHREDLVILVRPEFLLDVGSVQGGQTQAR